MSDFRSKSSVGSDSYKRNDVGSVKLTHEFDGILISPALKTATCTFLELKNVSDEWIAYKMKCTHPVNFTVKPSSCGLLPPKDSQLLRITLLPGYDISAVRSCELLVETLFSPRSSTAPMDAAVVWQQSVEDDITSTRFPINIVEKIKQDGDKLTVCLSKFPDNKEKTGTAQIKSVIELMQQEDLVAVSLISLFAMFVLAFFIGYSMHMIHCSSCEANSSCSVPQKFHK